MTQGNGASQQNPMPPHINLNDEAELRRSQNLVIAASIMAPVSMFIGGAFLSAGALVCAIISLTKIRKLLMSADPIKTLARRLQKACIVALIVSAITLVLNIVSVIIMYPILYEAIETGDLSGLTGQQGSGSSGNSTWG